jgi:D-galactose 1-dehydrogenase
LTPYSIVIIGVGKIARDQHLPVIAKNPRFRLAGVVSHSGARVEGVPTFATPAEAYAALPDLDAVAICTPPNIRYAIAFEALEAGKHVMLEKPPAQTVAEMHDLAARAAERGRVIFATWHSQYNSAVDMAKDRLAGAKLRRLAIEWKEDVRRWHPGQEWIWDAGNFGVFDPGINALSILTKIAPGPIFVKSASLYYPANRDTPIAASLAFSSPAAEPGASLSAEFDWRQEGEQSWNIDIETAAGERLRLTHGGTKLFLDGEIAHEAPMAEYEKIYAHFAGLLDARWSAMDASPFELVADAFLVGSRKTVDPFAW